MAAPSSAKDNAPKTDSTAPTTHAAKTTETVRPSRAISAGFRKIPVPIIVPMTIAAEAHAPSPRTSSRRFSVIGIRRGSKSSRQKIHLSRFHGGVMFFRFVGSGQQTHHGADQKSRDGTDQHIP